jgi:glycosyltransferase involved in cell wall biosynthesis
MHLTTPRVSVVMVCRDGLPFLEEALASAARQSMTRWELLFFDNGSTDGSREVARGRMPADVEPERWRIEGTAQSIPLGEARNRCVALARAPVIAFLDADDVWEDDKLAAQLERLDATGAGLVFSDASVVDARGTPLGRFFERWPPARDRVHEALLRGNFIPQSTVMVRRDVIESVGGFDPALHTASDYDLWLRVSRAARIEHIERPLARWRVHAANLTGDFRLAYGENVRILRGLLERATPEAGDAYERRVRRALAVLYWKWALRSLRSGEGLGAAVDRFREGFVGLRGGGAALAAAADLLRGQLRGLPLRIRLDRAARRAGRARDG